MTSAHPRRRALTALAIAAALAAGVTACGTGKTANTASTSAATRTGSTTELTTINNEKITVPGKKPTALFFFSVGCGTCGPGAKSLATAGQALQGKANVLAVDMNPAESPHTVRQFLGYIKAPQLPTAIDTGATLSQKYQVAALSTLIVIDPDGKVTYRATDPGTKAIQTALEKAGAQ